MPREKGPYVYCGQGWVRVAELSATGKRAVGGMHVGLVLQPLLQASLASIGWRGRL